MSGYLELCTLGDLLVRGNERHPERDALVLHQGADLPAARATRSRTGGPADAMMVAMVPVTRLYADRDGHARFEDTEIALAPDDPPPDQMSMSQPWPASAVLFGRGPAGGSHADQPEHRRQLVVGISGRVEVTASGETRTFGPGDVLLVEDTEGSGHSSRSAEGFLAAFVVLEG